ncbi:hypothetical protein LFREDSHE_24770 [Shewanella baltica]
MAISKALLDALVKYRQFLGLADYPAPNENHPLFVRHKAAGRGRDAGILNANLGIRHVRDEIQSIINLAAESIEADGFAQDGAQMRNSRPIIFATQASRTISISTADRYPMYKPTLATEYRHYIAVFAHKPNRTS